MQMFNELHKTTKKSYTKQQRKQIVKRTVLIDNFKKSIAFTAASSGRRQS